MKSDSNVGRAFRGKDGTVRWITGKSRAGNYQMLWLRSDGIWTQGGTTLAASWDASVYAGDEVPAPQPGETYKLAGVFDGYREVVV
jgi:hypothetical protein